MSNKLSKNNITSIEDYFRLYLPKRPTESLLEQDDPKTIGAKLAAISLKKVKLQALRTHNKEI